jgi:hypothetical protein
LSGIAAEQWQQSFSTSREVVVSRAATPQGLQNRVKEVGLV